MKHLKTPSRAAAILLPACLAGSLTAEAQKADAPRAEFSGTMFGAFTYSTAEGTRHQNQFGLERAYLTAQMPITKRFRVRVTADIARQTAGTGHVFRTKYAYMQYNQPAGKHGFSGFVRAGLQQTVAISHIDSYWPRWMGTNSIERFGYFQSADAGVSAQLNFPGKKGELYAIVSNGNGYSNPETDRFKSYAARLSLTPFSSVGRGVVRSLTISPWFDFNSAASKFIKGGPGQTAAVTEGLTRNRYGLFVALKDPNLVLATSWSRRIDGAESGDNTTDSPRTVSDVTGELVGAFAVIRPFQLADRKSAVPLSLLARYDVVTPDIKADKGESHLLQGSLILDLSKDRETQVALDYQEVLGSNGLSVISPVKMFQVRVVTSF